VASFIGILEIEWEFDPSASPIFLHIIKYIFYIYINYIQYHDSIYKYVSPKNKYRDLYLNICKILLYLTQIIIC
jgi:hypothetical protein